MVAAQVATDHLKDITLGAKLSASMAGGGAQNAKTGGDAAKLDK